MSGGPEAVGLCSSDINSILAVVNEATERLLSDPLCPDEGFWGSWARYAFTVSRSEPTFVTPQEVSRVILLDTCKRPTPLRNEFYEFLTFGPGFQPPQCSTIANPCQNLAAYERETVTTMEPLLSTPQIIRAYMQNPSDAGRTSIIQGEDNNGSPIFFVDAPTGNAGSGESITFAAPYVDSTNQFSTITGISKDKTFGQIQYFQVDPDTGDETSLLTMAPGETSANYRKYYINGLPNSCCVDCTPSTTLQVLAMCKLDYIPVACDSDYLRILSIPALIDEAMSVRYGRVDSISAQNLSQQKHASALRLLFGQLDNYLGKERPAIQRHIFGSQRLMPNPI